MEVRTRISWSKFKRYARRGMHMSLCDSSGLTVISNHSSRLEGSLKKRLGHTWLFPGDPGYNKNRVEDPRDIRYLLEELSLYVMPGIRSEHCQEHVEYVTRFAFVVAYRKS